jgi:hypothetical protein
MFPQMQSTRIVILRAVHIRNHVLLPHDAPQTGRKRPSLSRPAGMPKNFPLCSHFQ